MMDWLQILIPTIASGIFGGAFATWLKTRPQMAKVELEGEAALWGQISELRNEVKRERDLCEERISRIDERNDAALSKMEATLGIIRHERNNASAGFNALLTKIKRLDNPELSAIAEEVEEMVRRGDELIAVEKVALWKGASR
jgi:Rad3-related DNA helicase